ncbi:hypothetical protein SAMN02927921_03992 [Sinomicrobium oceani]|uniref:RHS repeat-associated core domain-containing protein n=1 Tax=Sinomicrobium oceani TaxID=1150368 RepID=A0A1K1RUG9_9FLAO|nr:hypothetical protein SAMN02927921_03992 [Sinomicrobium oceani]
MLKGNHSIFWYPLAEDFYSVSPYSFLNNSPLNFIDPTGMAPEDWVLGKNGNIYWDNNSNSQATTKAGDTYLGKNLTFTFTSVPLKLRCC